MVLSMLRFFFVLSLFFASCSSQTDSRNQVVQITGREPERIALYRVKVPEDWSVIYPDPNTSLKDSRLPLLEIFIDQEIRITIHNFPTQTPDGRIPPQAQIQRWIGQLANRDSTNTVVTPQSFSGYVGLLLETTGRVEEKEVSVIGWAMQLGQEHYRTLFYRGSAPEQSRSDVTIKVTGPPNLINTHRKHIFQFAKSFELIEEIPPPR